MILEHIGTGLILLIASIFDIKTKKLPILFTWISFFFAVTIFFIVGRTHIQDSMAGMAEGVVLVMLARITGVIGEGDGRVLCATGLLTGAIGGLAILMLGVLYMAFISIPLLCMKKIKGKDSLPFIPFLFLGYLTVYFMGEFYA